MGVSSGREEGGIPVVTHADPHTRCGSDADSSGGNAQSISTSINPYAQTQYKLDRRLMASAEYHQPHGRVG
ncbi:MAG: hypothetical protein HZB52_05970 [Chloroflexi bacterium]|nr:hypothetical protein [Chloroflexota bacterium]